MRASLGLRASRWHSFPVRRLVFGVCYPIHLQSNRCRHATRRAFSERLEAAIARYHTNAITTAQVIEELIQLAKDIKAARARGEETGLTDEEIAFYDALAENESAVNLLGNDTLRVLAQENPVTRSKDLHARFGGDEFCFLIPDLAECHQAHAVGERFREAVERYDWTQEDSRLAVQPVRVDVGVVCLWLGHVADRRFIARQLSADLIQRADKLMYEAKSERANHIYLLRAKLENGVLVDYRETDPPQVEDHEA